LCLGWYFISQNQNKKTRWQKVAIVRASTWTRRTRTHNHTSTRLKAHARAVCKRTHFFSQGCGFRMVRPRPYGQPERRRGPVTSRPMSYDGFCERMGGLIRSLRSGTISIYLQEGRHGECDLTSAVASSPEPRPKIDSQAGPHHTKPLSMKAVRKALRGEMHRCGGEVSGDSRRQAPARAEVHTWQSIVPSLCVPWRWAGYSGQPSSCSSCHVAFHNQACETDGTGMKLQ